MSDDIFGLRSALQHKTMSKVIYDFGMNNGDDVDYYLRKGFKVVGVEANPKLCEYCSDRFREQVNSRRLVILNVALSNLSSNEKLVFYVHKADHVRSQLPKPDDCILDEFDPVLVSQRKASDIVKEYGTPYYIKIDIEHFDHIVLSDLFQNQIVPDFISAEAHTIKVFTLLVAAGYRSFNLIDGSAVRWTYAKARISTPDGIRQYSFNHHSAGPFGVDILSPWMDEDSLFNLLSWKGLGWRDIHASTVIVADKPSMRMEYPPLPFRAHLKDLIPSFIRAVMRRIKR